MTNGIDPFQMYLSGFDAAIAFVRSLDDGSYLYLDNLVDLMQEELKDLERGMNNE